MRERMGVRIAGIQAPEVRTRRACEKRDGYRARDYLRRVLAPDNTEGYELRNIQRGKYFRIVAEVFIKRNGQWRDVAQIMLDAGHAMSYDGGTKSPWECTKDAN